MTGLPEQDTIRVLLHRRAAYEYAEVEDILKAAKDKGEAPFIFILDEIEDPHNLGAIIRTPIRQVHMV